MTTPKNELLPIQPPQPAAMQKAIEQLLLASGFSMQEPHLQETPLRVSDCWKEHLIDGYQLNEAEILSEHFPAEKQGLVIVQNIHVQGLCPHHLLPFYGHAHIAYLPKDRIVGFSKLAELTRCFSHRLTLQEKITHQICEALIQHLGALGAGCVLETTHMCMVLRGNDQSQCSVLSSHFLGELQHNPPWTQMLSHSQNKR